ncbi:glutathione peroxidase [Commensalibacter oyaizuii]|uniref:Glutathione peroxidase n=1 Tax=Commensalibacter oyaizuii TaxID=3043873 RepID=A0ABT6PYS2_9PROT|nr:glutathione peroxidase [Commensalibacter sp. TBRC 16381]MDI2090007.1 glutathione peroxidase [Commensalibacter sp. TBRC 16381]
MTKKTAYDFDLPLLSGKTINLNDYRGKPLLIVNTASRCKFTPQYEDLQDLWSLYRNWGLTIIAVPSGDFGGQEYDSSEEIKRFCSTRYNVGFLLSQKSHVKGQSAIPLFHWLSTQGGILAQPRWNFYKYIINRQGKLYKWFSSITRPSSKRFINAIERVSYDM